MVLDAAKISPAAAADVPVVETNLLTGVNGSALVLANYTYQPIDQLTIDVKLPRGSVRRAVSAQGSDVKLQPTADGFVRLTLPLKLTDIVLLK